MSVTFERLFRMAKPFANHSDLKSTLTPISRGVSLEMLKGNGLGKEKIKYMNDAHYIEMVLSA